VPVEQDAAVALAGLHETPQPPQLLKVFSWVSQPLVGLPSQSPYPALHEAIWQVPVEQVPVALAGLHETPQPPQLLVVFSGVSHPLFGLPSQSPYPAAQVGTHTPLVQVVVPWLFVQAGPDGEEVLPQVHFPLLQVSPLPQAFPQLPQFLVSVWVLAQMPLPLQ
jgi:hypothetical protein